jgi:hypothetical protein
MQCSIDKRTTGRRSSIAGLGAMLLGLLVAFPLSVAWATGKGDGGGSGSGSSSGGGGPTAPGEGVGSLPQMAEDDTPSLLLLGTRAAIQRTILGLHGPGDVLVQAFDPADPDGTQVALFNGTIDIHLDVPALASGAVTPYFYVGTTYAGGLASVGLGGHWSDPIELLPQQAIDLPLNTLSSTGTLASGPLRIDAISVDRDLFRLEITASPDVVLLRQTVQ